jgi:hypothetical protein
MLPQVVPAGRRVYTIREFCDAFRITKKTAYIWRQQGKVSFVKIGGHNVVTAEEANRLLAGEA